ncbi:protein ARV1 [Condylostylus longicornis]|uniref:protein ARV1 n=1 Tax=Condylostylus longicornis TaxID=2530218 RepID=UPI00244E5B83|nr:protein ARV1 [Condylostylus longicornis]XP_055384295.1 protein ARV1 [Condylostylus longicornis]
MSQQYACINCKNPVHHLYQKYPNLTKLAKCDKCHEIVDKYIEFHHLIALVDVILLSNKAYRHIIYNAEFKMHWKLYLILLLLESFALWRQKLEKFATKSLQVGELNVPEDFFQEKGFYMCCLENLIDSVVLFIILAGLSKIIRASSKRKSNFLSYLIKAVILGNFSKIFLLPILVWRDNTTELDSNFHYFVVKFYYVFSCSNVYSSITNLNLYKSSAVVVLAFFIKKYFMVLFNFL